MKNKPIAHYCDLVATPRLRYLRDRDYTSLEQFHDCTNPECPHGEWQRVSPEVVETDKYKKHIESKRFILRVKLRRFYLNAKSFFPDLLDRMRDE